MNPQIAAQKLLLKVDSGVARDPDGLGIEHAMWMLQGIFEGYIQHEKAHRWLGYAQGALVASETVSLDDMKRINLAASDEDRTGAR